MPGADELRPTLVQLGNKIEEAARGITIQIGELSLRQTEPRIVGVARGDDDWGPIAVANDGQAWQLRAGDGWVSIDAVPLVRR